jgi:ubiquinone/menaquinone biosynthesis C-methylase UbiE
MEMQLTPQELAFEPWAQYYDVTDADRDPFIEFYRRLITKDTRSVLELGCGTGTITIPLAHHLAERDGISDRSRVVGVDVSPGMLRIARARDPHIEWVLGDMRSPPVRGSFDLVICCFNTLQLLVGDDDLARALSAVRRLLSSEGRFAFDIYQPNLDYLNRPQTDRLARAVTDRGGRELEIREDTRYDPASRVLTIHWRLVERDMPEHPPLATTGYSMRQYFPHDVDRLLERAGLVERERYGDLDRSPFTPTSKKQVVICGRH